MWDEDLVPETLDNFCCVKITMCSIFTHCSTVHAFRQEVMYHGPCIHFPRPENIKCGNWTSGGVEPPGLDFGRVRCRFATST